MTAMGIIGVVILLYMVATISVLAYVSWRYLDYIESLMPRSLEIRASKQVYVGAGMPGKMIRLTVISTMIASSGFYVKKGLIDADDVKDFPVAIRQRLIALLYALYFMLLVILVGGYFY